MLAAVRRPAHSITPCQVGQRPTCPAVFSHAVGARKQAGEGPVSDSWHRHRRQAERPGSGRSRGDEESCRTSSPSALLHNRDRTGLGVRGGTVTLVSTSSKTDARGAATIVQPTTRIDTRQVGQSTAGLAVLFLPAVRRRAATARTSGSLDSAASPTSSRLTCSRRQHARRGERRVLRVDSEAHLL